MSRDTKTVLAVDDEIANLELIEAYLNDVDIETVSVADGEQVLMILQEQPQRFSAVLLNRMMPGIDGMEVLSRIKADDRLNHIPVIMQSGKAGKDNMLEGMNAGAHYYVAKPYDKQTLVAIVFAAVRDHQDYAYIKNNLKQTTSTTQTLRLMDHAMFRFKSLSEGRNLAALLANACPNTDDVILGLTELMINAVEHGNLGIGYDEKSRLNMNDDWEQEISRRLTLRSNKDKYVSIEFRRSNEEVTFLIADQGKGFDWMQYMEMSPMRVFDNHGRGIAMANSISFDHIEYLGSGNEVCVTVSL